MGPRQWIKDADAKVDVWNDNLDTAWDNTGGKVFDAIAPIVMYGPDDQYPEDAPINEFLRGVSGIPGNIAGGVGSVLENSAVAWPVTAAQKYIDWTSSPAGPSPYTAENFDRPLRNAETDIRFAPPEGPAPWEATTFTQSEFDPTGTSAPYDTYLGLLEGLAAGPATGRIEDMYELGQGEARRRMETADAWEATQGARLDTSDKALDAALIGMQDTFGERLTTIREGSVERQADTAELRDGLIEATAGELGEAAAAFMVSATRSGDVLESQRSRNESHMDDMDGLYSMWSLDRTMQAAGMKQQARRDLADDVLAMRELVHEFDYGIEMARLQGLQQAEQFAAGQNMQLQQTLAQIGLTRDLAVQSASSEADDDWQRANAWLSNPTTGWAFEGMTPEMVMGMSDAQMQSLYAEAIRSADQIEVAPGVFVDAETAWLNSQQTADPTMNFGGVELGYNPTVQGVGQVADMYELQASHPNFEDAIAAMLATQGVGGSQASLPVVVPEAQGGGFFGPGPLWGPEGAQIPFVGW